MFFLSLLGQIYTITVGVIGVMASVVILYHAAPIMQGLRKRVSKTTGVCIYIEL